MGFVRGGLLVIASVLFFLALIIGSIFLTFSLSLEYETIKPEISLIVHELIQEYDLDTEVDSRLEEMEPYCENNSEYVFSYEGDTFVIPCEIVNQGTDAIIGYGVETNLDKKIDEIYYGEYNCGFWDCFDKTEQPFFLISEKAKDYWKGKFYWMLGVIGILLLAMFFFAETKSNFFIIAGILAGLAAFVFSKFGWIFSLFSDKPFLEYLDIFFVKSLTVFLWVLVLGILLLIIGVVLKLFVVGFKINSFFDRDSKKLSRGEVKDMIKKESSEIGTTKKISKKK